ncbi:haloacid dehalogenase [Iodidimonas nitroreducens]|uniref:Haloacid dehalogenase n=1 Tax=Iodidimonas nitroreducens TaxID=1236968 RepID=A0A5A7N726_9PROT|nr:HAD family phosphatase [Iodidimonas nitroreducens]GAK34112.1 acyl-CoA dehydrogenase family member 10 [alpha proteobacterium Q-1]GER03787.1 haloacid dehalogenase [Iodidimonas nitroreducens]
MSAPVQAVIFDIGNVLVRWNPRRLYRQLIEDEKELDWFLETVVPLSWHTQHDLGVPFAENIKTRQQQFPEYADLIALFYERWDETIDGPIDGSVAILEQLDDAGVPVFALTNYSAETFPDFRRRFRFSDRFRDIVVSGAEGMVKPDPRLYDLAIKRFGVRAEHSVFIDDRPDNVEAAIERGLQGLVFTGPETLEQDLLRLGLPL